MSHMTEIHIWRPEKPQRVVHFEPPVDKVEAEWEAVRRKYRMAAGVPANATVQARCCECGAEPEGVRFPALAAASACRKWRCDECITKRSLAAREIIRKAYHP